METPMKTETTPTKTFVGPVRLSYANIFKPRPNTFKGGKEEYSVVLLFPKEPNEFCPNPNISLDLAKSAMKAAANEKFPAGAKYGVPLKDGDKDEAKYPGYWYMNAKSDYAPEILGPDRIPVTAKDGWDSGDWAKVVINFYGGEHNGIRNIGCGLRGIFFTQHDEHFSGGGGSVFDDYADEMGGPAPERIGTAPVETDEYDPFDGE